MLKIRLSRIGARQRPFYRVVVMDERSKRSGEYIELLGTYNPLTEPKEIKLKQDRIDHWIKQGAQMSDGFLRIIGKAPQRPARKPKKEKKEAPASPAPEAAKKEVEAQVTETETATPAEETQPAVEEVKAEITENSEASAESVIANEQSEEKQSSKNENPVQIATEPEAPRNDETNKEEEKDERPA